MKTSGCAGALLLGALILGGCAASPVQGAQMRVHTTMAAFVQQRPAPDLMAQRAKQRTHKASALVRACRSGNSKACGEQGDRLAIKYAYAEAHQWYVMACDRVSNTMLPSAERLLALSQELKRAGSLRSDDEAVNAANQKRVAELKSEATEIRSRIRGCFDAGDTMKLESERKQSLKYYDMVCEFSTLVEAVGEAVPGLEHVTESGCTAGQSARARLSGETELAPQLFVEVLQQHARIAAAEQIATQKEEGIVFNEGDLQ